MPAGSPHPPTNTLKKPVCLQILPGALWGEELSLAENPWIRWRIIGCQNGGSDFYVHQHCWWVFVLLHTLANLHMVRLFNYFANLVRTKWCLSLLSACISLLADEVWGPFHEWIGLLCFILCEMSVSCSFCFLLNCVSFSYWLSWTKKHYSQF